MLLGVHRQQNRLGSRRPLDDFSHRVDAVQRVSQDLPIWENKRYVARPIVTKSEKKLLEQREWALQFYSNYEPE